jgi:AcrR family transcriptional regulator
MARLSGTVFCWKDEAMAKTEDRARPVGSRPGGRSARVRAAVFGAALELLAEQGYEATSLPEIARRAGVHQATIYRRWETKRRLIGEAMLDRPDPLFLAPDTGTLRNDLAELLRRFAGALREPPVQALMEVLVTGSFGLSAELAEGRDRFWERRFGLARVIVERAVTRAEVREGTDPDSLIEMLIAPAFMRIFVTGRTLDDLAIEAMAERVTIAYRPGAADEPSMRRSRRPLGRGS